MDGSKIVVIVNLNGEQNRNQIKCIRLAIDDNNSNRQWLNTSIDPTKPFHTYQINFKHLQENETYHIVGQYQINEHWYDIDDAYVPSCKHIKYQIPLNQKTFQTNDARAKIVNDDRLHVAMNTPRFKTRAANSTNDSGAGGEIIPSVVADREVHKDYILPHRPTQQTQLYYDKNGHVLGEAGCCVACAIVSAKEVQERRQNKQFLRYSVGWFYGKYAANANSTYYITAFSGLRNDGIPPIEAVKRIDGKTFYPDVEYYNDAVKLVRNTGRISEYTLPQKIRSYEQINAQRALSTSNLNRIYRAIKNEGYGNFNSTAVVVTIEIVSSFDQATYQNGIVGSIGGRSRASVSSESSRGGHCMLVVGWGTGTTSGKKYWIVQNSWTYFDDLPYFQPCGDNGLYYIPFDWYSVDSKEDPCGLIDFYILYDDDRAPDLPPSLTSSTAFLEINDITSTTVRWTIHSLGNNFNNSNYKSAGVTSATFTTASNGKASIAGIVNSVNAPSANSSNTISGTVSNLDPSTKYTFWGFAQAANGKYYAMGNNQGVTFTTKSALKLWNWTSSKTSGANFNLTAKEWTAFCNLINEVRKAHGLYPYGFTLSSNYIASGKPFYAWIFKQAAEAIKEIKNNRFGVNKSCLNVATGSTIYASYFINLQEALNNAIRAL